MYINIAYFRENVNTFEVGTTCLNFDIKGQNVIYICI